MSEARLLSAFGDLPDRRIERTKRDKLMDSSALAKYGVSCGANEWDAQEANGRAKASWQRQFREVPHGQYIWGWVCPAEQ